jgi:hypothetical protein
MGQQVLLQEPWLQDSEIRVTWEEKQGIIELEGTIYHQRTASYGTLEWLILEMRAKLRSFSIAFHPKPYKLYISCKRETRARASQSQTSRRVRHYATHPFAARDISLEVPNYPCPYERLDEAEGGTHWQTVREEEEEAWLLEQ